MLQHISKGIGNKKDKIVWFHCASVGEFEQARPLIEGVKKRYPAKKILLTFFSPSGYELRKNYDQADWVFYLPMDTPKNVSAFLDIVSPEIAIFIKYEFWYNYITQIHKRGISLYLVSAIFRPNQMFFRWYGSFMKKMLYCYSHIFVQDIGSKSLIDGAITDINSDGCERVIVAGDTRFDRVAAIVKGGGVKLDNIASFLGEGDFCLVAGSTWEPDEKMLPSLLSSVNKLKIIVVPHEVDASRIDTIKDIFANFQTICFSNIYSCSDEMKISQFSKCRVLIVDCIGLLSSIYKYGDFAYIGGGFGVGIHNILEAATYGKPVIFGHNYQKTKEACDLIELKGAYSISTDKEFIKVVSGWIQDKDSYRSASEICRAYVNDHIGATDKILSNITIF